MRLQRPREPVGARREGDLAARVRVVGRLNGRPQVDAFPVRDDFHAVEVMNQVPLLLGHQQRSRQHGERKQPQEHSPVHVAIVALLLATGCAHKLRTSETHAASAEEAHWDKHAESSAETKRADETKQSERKAAYRRKTTPSPAGPIVEEEWSASLSELHAHSGVVAVSHSESTARGESKKVATASKKEMERRDPPGFSLPWWTWVGLVLFFLCWAARIAWKQGWRPWRR